MRAPHVVAAALTALAAIPVAGCGAAGGVVGRGQPPSSASTASPSPRPVRTIIRDRHVVRAGRTVRLEAQAGVRLSLTVSKPSFSRTRLSPSYGYPPQHGFYLTVRVTVVNDGSRAVHIAPQNFVVHIPGQGRVTSYDGNSPYSGASRQLDTTEIEPGQRVRAPLTFDVSGRHGRIAFVPDESPAVVWRF